MGAGKLDPLLEYKEDVKLYLIEYSTALQCNAYL